MMEQRTTVQQFNVSPPIETYIVDPDPALLAAVVDTWKIINTDLMEMTGEEKVTLNAAALPVYKAMKYAAVDNRTDELFTTGFASDSKTFSLSLAAQITIAAWWNDEATVYSIKVSTIDDSEEIELEDASALDTHYVAMSNRVRTIRDGDKTLKAAIRAATTQTTIDAIVDSR